MRRRHVVIRRSASGAQWQSGREDQPFDELTARNLIVRVEGLIGEHVGDVAADQEPNAVFRPVAGDVDRTLRLRPCGRSGDCGSDEDDDHDDAHGAWIPFVRHGWHPLTEMA